MIYPMIKKVLLGLIKLKNLINIKIIKEMNLMLGVVNLSILKMIAKVSLSNLFQIFIIIIVMDMDIMQ